jgi:hypothetical protein
LQALLDLQGTACSMWAATSMHVAPATSGLLVQSLTCVVFFALASPVSLALCLEPRVRGNGAMESKTVRPAVQAGVPAQDVQSLGRGGPLSLIAGPAGPARDGLFDVAATSLHMAPATSGLLVESLTCVGFFAPCIACVIGIMLSKPSMKVNDPSLK